MFLSPFLPEALEYLEILDITDIPEILLFEIARFILLIIENVKILSFTNAIQEYTKNITLIQFISQITPAYSHSLRGRSKKLKFSLFVFIFGLYLIAAWPNTISFVISLLSLLRFYHMIGIKINLIEERSHALGYES